MVALVALGGAAGAVARAGVAAAMRAPWATLTVNLVGAFVLGGLLGGGRGLLGRVLVLAHLAGGLGDRVQRGAGGLGALATLALVLRVDLLAAGRRRRLGGLGLLALPGALAATATAALPLAARLAAETAADTAPARLDGDRIAQLLERLWLRWNPAYHLQEANA